MNTEYLVSWVNIQGKEFTITANKGDLEDLLDSLKYRIFNETVIFFNVEIIK